MRASGGPKFAGTCSSVLAGANRRHCRLCSAALSARARQLTPSALERDGKPERGTMTRARIAALLVALSCVAVPATAHATSPAALMLKKVNAYRAAHGVPKVRFNRSPAHSAAAYSRHMMRSGYFGHARRIHASRRFRTLGEII